MKILLVIALSALAGVIAGVCCCAAAIRHLRRQVRELRAIIKGKLPPAKPETMKRFVWACILNGFAWVWCSYILAALDKVQIAEELSKVALIEIIAPVAVYAGKSVLENLSKNNRWPDKDGGCSEGEFTDADRQDQ